MIGIFNLIIMSIKSNDDTNAEESDDFDKQNQGEFDSLFDVTETISRPCGRSVYIPSKLTFLKF